MVKKRTIMVADDDENIRLVLNKYLTAKGFEIIEAEDGEEALDLIENKKNIPDIIILDIMMPGKNGFEVCEHLRNHKVFSMIPILMLTALSTPESVIKGLSLGADDYIKKPFNLEELYIRIKNIISKGTISETLKKVNSEYKKIATEFEKEKGASIDKLTKLPILPALFENLRKKYDKGFYIVYIDTDEILKYEKIFNWKIIDDYIYKISKSINEFVDKNCAETLISVRKVYAGDFILFFSQKDQEGQFNIEKLKKNLIETTRKNFPNFSEYQNFFYITGHQFEKDKNVRFEREIYRNIFTLLKKIADEKDKYYEYIRLSVISGNFDLKNEEIKSIDNEKIGYAVKFIVEGTKIIEIFRFCNDAKKIREMYIAIIEKMMTNFTGEANFFIPIHKLAVNEDMIFTIREKKLPKNYIFTFDDIDVANNILSYREQIEMLKYLGHKIAIFNYGTIASNLDTIMAIQPDYVFLHQLLTEDIEKNYIKQDLVKSLINLQNKLNVKIVGNNNNREIQKNIGVKYFREGL